MVSILMAVYNGEMYLQEQLNSIESQTVRDWNLIVRDDGSSDQTKEIIREFAGRVSQKVVLLDSDSDKHGPKYNFFALLNETQDSYIMFCDQDDVWKKDKIEKTVAKMQSIEKNAPGTPVLVHTDLEVVDAKGNTISKSFFDSANLKKKSKHSPVTFTKSCDGMYSNDKQSIIILCTKFGNALYRGKHYARLLVGFSGKSVWQN